MTDQPQLDTLIAQIRQQIPADRATIRQQLLAAGYPPPLVDQALDQVFGPAPAAAPRTSGLPAPQTAPLERIRAYLEQHQQTYSREALRSRLIQDGHDPQAIDLAITQVYGFQVSATSPPPASRTTLALTIVGLFLFNYLIWGIALALVIQGSSANALWLVPAMLVLEGIAAVAVRSSNRSLSRGLAWGIAASLLPIVTGALLFGICIAIFSSLY